MAYAIQNISSLPFESIIGGPLKAAVEAQGIAAKSTVDFITDVGFQQQEDDPFFLASGDDEDSQRDLGPVQTVTFAYTTTDDKGNPEDASLTVPILTIVPIPYLRIDEMSLDFTAKITESISTDRKSASATAKDVSVRAGAKWGPFSFGLKASYSAKHSSSAAAASRYSTELTMNIHIRAVQDDIPAGLGRVLDILETTIRETRTPASTGGTTGTT